MEGDPSASHAFPDRLQPHRLCRPWAELAALLPAGTIKSPKQGGELGPRSVCRGSPVRSSKNGGLERSRSVGPMSPRGQGWPQVPHTAVQARPAVVEHRWGSWVRRQRVVRAK